jgi:dihydropteroate synthase
VNIRGIRREGIVCPISVDTRRAVVAEQAIDAGANMINDVSGGRFDNKMFEVIGRRKLSVVIMHSRGTPQSMTQPQYNSYNNVVNEVIHELRQQLHEADNAGIPKWFQIIDVGIGFAKTKDDNMKLLKPETISFMRNELYDCPMLLGSSRKRFLNHYIDEASDEHSGKQNWKELKPISYILDSFDDYYSDA